MLDNVELRTLLVLLYLLSQYRGKATVRCYMNSERDVQLIYIYIYLHTMASK